MWVLITVAGVIYDFLIVVRVGLELPLIYRLFTALAVIVVVVVVMTESFVATSDAMFG